MAYIRSYLHNNTGKLMAQCHRRLIGGINALPGVQIRSADTSICHTDLDHVAIYLRFFYFAYFQKTFSLFVFY
jgi:hypothetical protein